MNITYNKTDQLIVIKDDLPSHYTILKVLLLLNVLNAVLNLFNMNTAEAVFIQIIWLFLGLISVVFLYILFFKRTSLSKIPFKNIKALDDTAYFGKKRFSVILRTGKKRYLPDVKTESDFSKLKNVFIKNGIEV